MRRQKGQHSFRVVDVNVLKIARVGAEFGHLAGHRVDDVRMGVPDMGNVVVDVEILDTVGVVEKVPPAADDA